MNPKMGVIFLDYLETNFPTLKQVFTVTCLKIQFALLNNRLDLHSTTQDREKRTIVIANLTREGT